MTFWNARNTRLRTLHGLTFAPGQALGSLVLLCAIGALIAPAHAIEPSEEFLRGLQERGLHELALDYLDQMKTSGAVADGFRDKIPYHRGLVLVSQSRQVADSAARKKLLDRARIELEQFAESNPENVQGAEANLELGSLQMAQGQQLMSQVSQLSSNAAFDAQRRTQSREARQMFAEARTMFQQAEEVYSAELEKLPPTSSQAEGESGNRRQEYRGRVAQLRYLAAQSQFEAARSHPAEADEYRELNEAAAAELSQVYEEYGRSASSLVGLYARLAEGRCYQALGQLQSALGCFEDILSQSNVLPPFRKLIASAVHRKAEVLIGQTKYDGAIEVCNTCLTDAKSGEEKQPEWLGVKFRLAEALQKKGESLAEGSSQQRKLLAEARDIYRAVAAAPGEFQLAARTAAKGAATSKDGDDSKLKEAPRNFKAAYEAGKEALASYNAAKLALPSAEKNNPEAIPELKTQMEQGKEEARRNFQAATVLVDDDTDPKLLNEVRYFLCWLYWEYQDYYRAAVLGDFLARRYPDHPAAASAAKLAMASYERLYTLASGADGKGNTDFEAAQMAGIAEFITRRWPDSEDASAAQSVLASFAIRNNRIEDAEKLLDTASEDARPKLELQLGNAMWGRYLELSQPNARPTVDAESLAKLKQSAVKYLQSGFEAARKNNDISESTAAGGLYLAQALLGDEKYDEAIELLEDKDIGPLTLVANEASAASRPQFAVEAYKAALRAYVLLTPPQEKKALATMKSLEKAIVAAGGSEEQVTQIYIGLGMALEKQAAQLREAGRQDDAARITAAFAQFLDRIASRQEGANWPTRAWLAQTYYNMGAPQSSGSSPAPPKATSNRARDYLTKSQTAYTELLADAAKDPKLAPSETSVLAARLQLGECQRALGKYQDALDTFSSVLKERESSLAVQRSAAQTYQDRGQVENAKWFENAIHGGYRLKSTGQNRIWGWLKISQVAAQAARSDAKYRDTFFEARMNVARCRYLAAMKRQGDERKADLARAKQSIQSLAQVYPNLGGDRWRNDFDTLLKEIQVASGQKPTGLGEFTRSSPSNGSKPAS